MHSDEMSRKLEELYGFYVCFQNMPIDNHQYRASWLKALYSVMLECRRINKNGDHSNEANALILKIYQETKHELLHSRLSWARKLRILILYNFPSLYSLLLKLRYGLFG